MWLLYQYSHSSLFVQVPQFSYYCNRIESVCNFIQMIISNQKDILVFSLTFRFEYLI